MKINAISQAKTPAINTLMVQKKEPQVKTNYASNDNIFKYMTFTSLSPISFMGKAEECDSLPMHSKYGIIKRSNTNPTFEDTIEDNYFKLPIIKTKFGREIQALPDKTQLACAESLYQGDNTFCIAPTGTGKTAIANYAITKNMNEGKKTIYTTPLKALSNDKYREFTKIYGKDNVGILTGDIKINGSAPILIMTTEIYRNMALSAYGKNDYSKFDNVQTVIFDEAHYINEKERGKIWEESIMLTPHGVQILPLSATVGNGKELTDWINTVTDKNTNLIEAGPKDRHVPLVYYNYTGAGKSGFQELIKGTVNINKVIKDFENDEMSQRQIRAIDILVQKRYCEDNDYHATREEQAKMLEELQRITRKQKNAPHQKFSHTIQKNFGLRSLEAQEVTQLLIDSDSRTIKWSGDKNTKDENRGDYRNLALALKDSDKLPALVFIFSRKNCNYAAEKLANAKLNLTTPREKEQIQEIIDKYKEEGVYFGDDFSEKELLQGVAVHHAGLLPSYKKLVEELFSKKLVKMVFATSTLSAGINMPAKTVVITSVDRPTASEYGEISYVPLTSNEFHQMAGRAGRRGIDTIGNVVLYKIKTNKDTQIAKDLILKSPDKITSKYSPNYSFLPAYYEKCEDDELLNYFEGHTLKVFQAEKQDKEARRLQYEFIKYRNILVEKGFLKETQNGGFRPTEKGKMLTKVHGYNELTLIDSIYNENLKNLNPAELASFAASMGAEKNYSDEDNDNVLFAKYLTEQTTTKGNSRLIDALDKALDCDEETEDLEYIEKVKDKTSNTTGILEAAVAYAFASANQENPEGSVENFRNIKENTLGNYTGDFTPSTERSMEDGILYGKLAKSVDVLKQIINICEYEMEDPECQNYRYYENLADTALDAIDLIAKPPIYDLAAIKYDEN